ncbi:5059_t:CDS:2 [Diversispora eburnea]|uniref:5059_t:CDS:1 n=1 Tax=Diversispora eburnea TaxID=1213867 RepID=A0A9N8ZPE5_9GLOM|nr:5059_t:CDS:2 [Diversispora eburnea]
MEDEFECESGEVKFEFIEFEGLCIEFIELTEISDELIELKELKEKVGIESVDGIVGTIVLK